MVQAYFYSIYEKACKRLNLFRLLKHTLDRGTLIKIYFAVIRSVLEYGDVVWGNCTKDNSDLLEKIQIEATRIITRLRVNSSKSHLYSELGWEPLQARSDKHQLTLFYKIINGIAPQYMSDLIKLFFQMNMYIILGQVEIYFVCHYAEQLLITTVLFHQQSNSGMS